jgi:hypothetical protein
MDWPALTKQPVISKIHFLEFGPIENKIKAPVTLLNYIGTNGHVHPLITMPK